MQLFRRQRRLFLRYVLIGIYFFEDLGFFLFIENLTIVEKEYAMSSCLFSKIVEMRFFFIYKSLEKYLRIKLRFVKHLLKLCLLNIF